MTLRNRIVCAIAAIVAALAANAVTLTVKVPDGTRTCYVAGDFQGWSALDAVPMTKTGTNLFSLTLDDVSTSALAAGYKYLSGPDWTYVEKDASGGEISNRTACANPDVVGSWYHVYNADINGFDINLNGHKRRVQVLLPDGYADSSEAYPVIYLTGVQQRFNKAGDDSDRGDDFFGSASWNIPNRVDNNKAIMVSVYGYFAENMPFINPEFMGSGASADFAADLISILIPEINKRYRTLTGPQNTTILGADVGAMLSLYTAASHPEVFGTCVAMSPLSILNSAEMIEALAAAEPSQRYILSYGTLESISVTGQASAIATALRSRTDHVSLLPISGGRHDDEAWGEAFPTIFAAITSASAAAPAMRAAAASPYTLCNAIDSQSLVEDNTAPFAAVTYHRTSGTTAEAWASVKAIPVEVKTKYYWNVKCADGTWLLSSNKNLSFSSKKNSVSWHRVIIYDDGTCDNMAASSTAFRLKTAAGSVDMAVADGYTVSAQASLPGADKSVTVNYGSVNSGSDMGACSPTVTLPDDCTSATVTFNFATNEITYTYTPASTDPATPDVPEPSSDEYTLYNAIDSQSLVADNSVTFSDVTYYSKSGTSTAAKALVKEIPASVKTKYYWNVGRAAANGTVEYLKSTNGNIGFSSKKTDTSWHRVVVKPDRTVEDIAASSAAFRMVTADATKIMTVASGYKVTANATFNTTDKSVTVNYGSVNSGSDMGAASATVYAPDNCLAATVEYNFLTNAVTITPTTTGQVAEDLSVSLLSAVPSVARVGQNTTVTLVIDNPGSVYPALFYDINYGSTVYELPLSRANETTWTATLSNLQAGIYNLSLNLTRDGATRIGAATMSVKVIDGEPTPQKSLTVNAYSDVNWDTYGQHKGNFHTHTSQSFDTQYTVSQVVDRYHNAGYTILALTDHDANPYPWTLFDVFNPSAQPRDPEALGMLAIPGVELSKDNTNSWDERTGGNYNHHNDFFTGRRGQEFASLRESYEYTYSLGGMQIINHPGQYWNLDTNYSEGQKNSPSWHADNFILYPSLVGLEVYNQGNRRPNDRILWDQILDRTMPQRPVWGYSNDDTHVDSHYFRNYQYMLLPALSVDELKIAMAGGHHYFCYEYTGSGQGKCPRISNITVDTDAHTITIDTDAADVKWIAGTDRNGSLSSRKSTVVGVGATFNYTDFQGTYVRALITNKYGETCTQPFGFDVTNPETALPALSVETATLAAFPNPAVDILNVVARGDLELGTICLFDLNGRCHLQHDTAPGTSAVKLSIGHLPGGIYLLRAADTTVKIVKK